MRAAVRGARRRPGRPAGAAWLAWLLVAASWGAPAGGVAAVDDSGATVRLAAPARRIVSLAPDLTEQLFAIGAGDAIVATTDYADYPPAAHAIARVGNAQSLDIERIAALHPDLIVVWGSGYPPGVQATLRRLGAPIYVSEPETLETIATSLERLGTLTGTSVAAHQAAATLRSQLATLRREHAGRRRIDVFYQIWSNPLMTLGGHHVVSEALRLCGARNVFEELQPIAPQVALEAVIAADPEMIVTAEPGAIDRGALDGWRAYPSLRAVRNGQLVTLDADRINRHTPRIGVEIAALCRAVDVARRAAAR